MNEVGVQLIARFLDTIDKMEAIKIWTLIQILCDAGDSLRWRDAGYRDREEVLDDRLVEQVLDLGSNAEVARLLTKPIGQGLHVSTFWKYFERICEGEVDAPVLLHIGYAADRFLDRHRGAFTFPHTLLWRLLRSDDLRLRLRGIMLLSHSDVTPQDGLEEIVSGIELGSPETLERFDLCCLTAFREFVTQRGLAEFDDRMIARMRNALMSCLTRYEDATDKEIVRSCMSYLPSTS